MTIDDMRALVALPGGATDAEVVLAFAALISDGTPSTITLVEPVTVEMARQQCRIDDAIEDDLIEQKISSAREWCEDYTGRIVAQRPVAARVDAWGRYIELSGRPIVSVDAVAYQGDPADELYADAVYSIGLNPLRLYAGDDGFPDLRTNGSAVVIYTAGYAEGSVPASFIEAILVLVGGMMSEREGAYARSREAAQSLIDRLRVQVM